LLLLSITLAIDFKQRLEFNLKLSFRTEKNIKLK
jgi:hypothetical protein